MDRNHTLGNECNGHNSFPYSVVSEVADFDAPFTALMMQKFAQMEKQFKEAAQFAVFGRALVPKSSSVIQQTKSSFSAYTSPATSAIEAALALQKQYQTLTEISTVSSTPPGDINQGNEANGLTTTPETVTEESPTEVTDSFGKGSEQEKNSPTVTDFESMGRVDVVEVSASQLRRERKARLKRKYQIMKRGRFWEINELRKERGL